MLKIDAATCRDRSVLGIKVQYTEIDKNYVEHFGLKGANLTTHG